MPSSSSVIKPVISPVVKSVLGGLVKFLSADSGYVFVYTQSGSQVYHQDGRPVQVLSSYANS